MKKIFLFTFIFAVPFCICACTVIKPATQKNGSSTTTPSSSEISSKYIYDGTNMKKKIVTFSFDDGILQDKRLIEILDKYGLKGTFNVNSGSFGQSDTKTYGSKTVDHSHYSAEQLPNIYKNHELAVHTYSHFALNTLSEEDIIKEIKTDEDLIEKASGKKVIGMAYPNGAFTSTVINVIKNNTDIQYARTANNTKTFDLPTDLYRWTGSTFCYDPNLSQVGIKFLYEKTDDYRLLYVWGHSYDLDVADYWKQFESFCKYIAFKDDVSYVTNGQFVEWLKKNPQAVVTQ